MPAQGLKNRSQKWRTKQQEERAPFATVSLWKAVKEELGVTFLYLSDNLQSFTVCSPNLPFPTGLSKPRHLFRAGHLNSAFPSKKPQSLPALCRCCYLPENSHVNLYVGHLCGYCNSKQGGSSGENTPGDVWKSQGCANTHKD